MVVAEADSSTLTPEDVRAGDFSHSLVVVRAVDSTTWVVQSTAEPKAAEIVSRLRERYSAH